MDFSVDTWIAIIGLFLGGGGIGTFFTWRYTRRKEKAEAESAETTAAKELQDIYQQLIDDVKKDRDEQKTYIGELKEDRRHLREERDELRNRQDKTEEEVRELRKIQARQGMQIEAMRPFLCYDTKCKKRQLVEMLAGGVGKKEEVKDE